MKKNIYFLINSLEGGGAERVIINVTEKLSETYNITIITLKDINFYELPKNVSYLPLSKIKNNLLMFLLLPWYIIRFKQILKQLKFDDGISFLELSNFINILVSKKANISVRVSLDYYNHSSFFYRQIIKFLYRKSNKIVVNSEENRYDITDYLNISPNKILTIHNPINLNQFETLKKEKIFNFGDINFTDNKVFINTSRLVWQKHHINIIRAFKTIYSTIDKNFIYLIIGDGPERVRLEELVNNSGLRDNIIFLGTQTNVFKYLDLADYFVYASEYEGFPNVLIEAMACNLPIITSDFKTGAKECIIGKFEKDLKNIKYPYYGANGVLLDLCDYEELFIEVYKNLDKVKQEKLGFERFDVEKSIEKYFELFN